MADWRTLPGHVDLSEGGLVMGDGPAFMQYLEDQQVEASRERAAIKFPEAAANRVTTMESLGRAKGSRCTSCGEEAAVLAGGLCERCAGAASMVFVAPAQVTCSLCDGRGTVDLPDDSQMIEKPFVAVGDE